MNAVIKITTPGKVECSVTITMELATWKLLANQLGAQYPSWQLGCIIRKLIEKVDVAITSEETIEL